MRHGISERQWLEFLEDSAEPGEAVRIQQHLAECPECSGLYAQLRAWGEAVQREATCLRRGAELSEPEIDRLLAGALNRIRTTQLPNDSPSRIWSAQEAMMLLRLLLAPLCGLGTARAAIRFAATEADANGENAITGDNWRNFVSNLSQTISQQCGLATGRLVGRVGISLGIEEG
jgi:hypothetical protein